MSDPQVTVCIPTWQSEDFIDDTLHQVRGQTHRNLRISVAVDRCEDRTEEICRRHAAEDDRVDVFAHDRRVGWARNVNHLIDRVDTEFFFLLMHDDVIDPRYVETLLARLQERPDAASAQCETLHVLHSGRQYRSWGTTHEGPDADRVIAAVLDPGAPLRALVRTRQVEGLARFGAESARGWESHVPYHLGVFAAGPALHVPDVLYWRRSGRAAGVVSAWSQVPTADLVADQRVNAQRCLAIISRMQGTPSEAAMMRFAARLAMMLPIRLHERRSPRLPLIEPREIADDFDDPPVPSDWKALDTPTRRVVAAAWVNLARVEASLHLVRRSPWRAIRSLVGPGVRPLLSGIVLLIRRWWRRGAVRIRPYELPPEIRSWLVGRTESGAQPG